MLRSDDRQASLHQIPMNYNQTKPNTNEVQPNKGIYNPMLDSNDLASHSPRLTLGSFVNMTCTINIIIWMMITRTRGRPVGVAVEDHQIEIKPLI